MTIHVYVSLGPGGFRQYGFLPTDSPETLLPPDNTWTYLRSAGAEELGLSPMEIEHLEHTGFEAHEARGSYAIR